MGGEGMGVARQARAMATRAKIVRAAAEVFEERGFDGAGLDEIVARAGVTKGGLYFHFRSQEDLAHHIITEQPRVSITLVETIGARRAPAVEKMVMLSHAMVRQIRSDRAGRHPHYRRLSTHGRSPICP
ncbi:hypothetical protein MLGJGCBP_10179 [Rhodococcus sp. T7]|nr:hypothetical protein MLGJGCBP_10179 [Rhodococcus sp. T7]